MPLPVASSISSHDEFEALCLHASYLSEVGALEELRARIAGFPGYDGDLERRHSDQYVRSYLGEALVELAARCRLPSDQQQRLDDLVLRVGFSDPHAFARHYIPAAEKESSAPVAAADAATVELADRASTLDVAAVPGFLDEVAAALDERDAAMQAAT